MSLLLLAEKAGVPNTLPPTERRGKGPPPNLSCQLALAWEDAAQGTS